jgi:Skp family chaperone for outer membrane proteins
VTDRFFGNGKIRGFEPNGIGPRDGTDSDALGGNAFAVARFEADFPLGLPEEYGITGGAFLDVGSVWSLDNTAGLAAPSMTASTRALRSACRCCGTRRSGRCGSTSPAPWSRKTMTRSRPSTLRSRPSSRAMTVRAPWAALALLCAGALAAPAQEPPAEPAGQGGAPAEAPRPMSLVLTLNQERLFRESLWGKAALQRAEAEAQALAAENRRIEDALEAEERSLTDRRATMEPAAFAAVAAEFDTRVEAIRAAQDGKSRTLTRQLDEDRQAFFTAATPILGQILRDTGAVAILADTSVVLSLSAIDVTDDAIARMDAAMTAPAPAPDAGPQSAPAAPAPAPAPAAPPDAPRRPEPCHPFVKLLAQAPDRALRARSRRPLPVDATAAPTTADLDLIQRIIPHRYPFLLIDKVRDIVVNKSCVGIKCIT